MSKFYRTAIIDFHAPLAFWFFWACQKNGNKRLTRTRKDQKHKTNQKTEKRLFQAGGSKIPHSEKPF